MKPRNRRRLDVRWARYLNHYAYMRRVIAGGPRPRLMMQEGIDGVDHRAFLYVRRQQKRWTR